MVNKTMGDDLINRLRSDIIVHTDAAVWMVEAANRIEKLEAMMKWGDEISNIQAARIDGLEAKLATASHNAEIFGHKIVKLEAKLAKAVNAIKLALEAINGKVDSGKD